MTICVVRENSHCDLVSLLNSRPTGKLRTLVDVKAIGEWVVLVLPGPWAMPPEVRY